MAIEQEATLGQLQTKSDIISRNIDRRKSLDEDIDRRARSELDDIDQLNKWGGYRERLATRITVAQGRLGEVQQAIAEHSLLNRAQQYLDEVASYKSKLTELKRLVGGGYIVEEALEVHQSRYRRLAALPGADPELKQAIDILSEQRRAEQARQTGVIPTEVPIAPFPQEVEEEARLPNLSFMDHNKIQLGSRTIQLTPQEYKVLEALAKDKGRTQVSGDLSEELFNDPDPKRSGLNDIVLELGRKLYQPGQPNILEIRSIITSVERGLEVGFRMKWEVLVGWDEETVSEEKYVPPVEKLKKSPREIYKISLPNGKEIGFSLRAHTQIQLLERLLETSVDQPVSYTELLEHLYKRELDQGVPKKVLTDRLSVVLSVLRKRLEKIDYQIGNLSPPGGRLGGRYYLKEVGPAGLGTKAEELGEIEETPDVPTVEEELAPKPAEPSEEELSLTSEAGIKSFVLQVETGEVTPEIREILYTPSEQEVRTDEETRILSVLVDNLLSHTTLYFDKLQRELRSADRLEQSPGGIKFYIYQAQELRDKFISAYQKMLRQEAIPALRSRWSEEDEKLWDKMQAVYARLEARDVDNFFAKIQAKINTAQREFYKTYQSGNGGRPYIIL